MFLTQLGRNYSGEKFKNQQPFKAKQTESSTTSLFFSLIYTKMLIVTYQSVTGLFQDLVQRTFRGLYKSNKMHVDIGH